jgi:hypothetical protein
MRAVAVKLMGGKRLGRRTIRIKSSVIKFFQGLLLLMKELIGVVRQWWWRRSWRKRNS